MSSRFAHGFSFFRSGGGADVDKGKHRSKRGVLPILKLKTDKEIYRPGDSVVVTVEICSAEVGPNDAVPSVLVDSLGFEVKGMEKLDPQWFSTQKPPPGSKRRRGEHFFLDCSTPSIISKVILSAGSTKTYMVRVDLPKILPPSYRGTSIRYVYYARSTLQGRWLVLENGYRDKRLTDELIQLEARASLQIWVTQQSSNLLSEEALAAETYQMDIYWKEKDPDSEWVRANDVPDEIEEGYDSSRDEVSSVSSFNPTRSADIANKSSLSLQSMVTRASNSESQHPQGDGSSFPTYIPLSRLSVAEIIDNHSEGLASPMKKYPSTVPSPKLQRMASNSSQADREASPVSGPVEPVA